MNSDNVTVLDSKIVANHSVDTRISVFEVIVGEDDQDGVLALFSLDKHGISSEEL